MASGLGKRFGSNKLMASFHGTPLIHSVLDVTGSVPLFADRLVVTRSREVHDYCQSLGIPVLIHTLPNRNEALCLGLTHMLKRHPDLSGCLFALGDQPLLRPRTLELNQMYPVFFIIRQAPETRQIKNPLIQILNNRWIGLF